MALESLARQRLNEYIESAPSVLKKFLGDNLRFNVSQDSPNALSRATSTYCHLRNAVFHNGRIEKTVNVSGNMLTYELVKYWGPFCRLAPLAVLRDTGFTHADMEWDDWYA